MGIRKDNKISISAISIQVLQCVNTVTNNSSSVFIFVFLAIGPLDKSLVKALIEAEEQKISEKISRVKTCMDECKVL